MYDIPDGTHPEPPLNARPFFNGSPIHFVKVTCLLIFVLDDRTRAAIHAPTSKNWSSSFSYPFGNVHNRCKLTGHYMPCVFLTKLQLLVFRVINMGIQVSSMSSGLSRFPKLNVYKTCSFPVRVSKQCEREQRLYYLLLW